jgi:hypothetical protein
MVVKKVEHYFLDMCYEGELKKISTGQNCTGHNFTGQNFAGHKIIPILKNRD